MPNDWKEKFWEQHMISSTTSMYAQNSRNYKSTSKRTCSSSGFFLKYYETAYIL
jgi:hypothetical protein